MSKCVCVSGLYWIVLYWPTCVFMCVCVSVCTLQRVLLNSGDRIVIGVTHYVRYQNPNDPPPMSPFADWNAVNEVGLLLLLLLCYMCCICESVCARDVRVCVCVCECARVFARCVLVAVGSHDSFAHRNACVYSHPLPFSGADAIPVRVGHTPPRHAQ